VHERQEPAVRLLLLAELLVHELHDVVVLGVHHHDPVVRRDLLHGELDPSEVEPVGVPLGMRRQHVDREYLEARESRLDRLGQLIEGLERQGALEGHVEGVVGVRVALPARGARLDHLLDVGARAHEAEVDVGGRPAEDHPPGVLFRPQRREILLGLHRDEVRQVRVRLDAARHDDLAAGVDHPPGLEPVLRQAQRDDALSFDGHVPPADALRRDDVTPANHEIQHHASSLVGARGTTRRARRSRQVPALI